MADATCSVCEEPAEPDNRLKAGKHIRYCYQWARRNATSKKPCSTPECGRAEFSGGLCNRCYQRAQRGNDPAARAFRRSNAGKTCSVEWCMDPAQRVGWCTNCYDWSRRHEGADPTARRYRYGRTVDDVVALVMSIAPDPESGCRVTTGHFGSTEAGYAVTTIQGSDRLMVVTRLILARQLGRPLGPAMQACHTCDNPPCAEPSHLWEGTAADNAADRDTKGRGAVGVRNSRARLDPDKVRAIRARYTPGLNQHDSNVTSLAREFGVTPQTIRNIANRHSWSHVM
ncbi:hypothetical protein ACFRQM_09240 [Streptomyces sp. NPDC056831]|uniref:hypothetical protein n=1 Tax=Streptomyces sp. NPDC056831 TaxID=3345954 RepID=UPI003697088E